MGRILPFLYNLMSGFIQSESGQAQFKKSLPLAWVAGIIAGAAIMLHISAEADECLLSCAVNCEGDSCLITCNTCEGWCPDCYCHVGPYYTYPVCQCVQC